MSNDAAQALTHHVRLVLDNDEGLYHSRCSIVVDVLNATDPAQDATPDLAASLKDWCEELCGLEDAEHNLATELLTTALAFVDWDTLARDYLEELDEDSEDDERRRIQVRMMDDSEA